MRLKLPQRIITLVCAASLLAYACGDSTSPVDGKPVSLTLIPSEFTLNAVGDTKDLTATVYDALGNVIDTTVQFEPSDPAVVTVTAAGKVTATGVGVASVTASLGSLTKTSEVNVFPVGTDVQPVSGNLQSAVVGTALPEPLVVQVSDPGGNPVPGIEVSFTVVSGGGSLTVDSAITDANGRASTVLTLGNRTEAINRVAVLAGGVGSTEFTATGLADVPQEAQVLTGDGQMQPVGTTLPIDLSVLVRDQFGNGVPGQDVNYAVLTGGGSITPATVQTDANGVAQAQWTLGATLGTQTAEADVPVLSATPAFSAEATDLSVTGVTPDTLVEGQPAQITGTGFDAVISNVMVTVDGVAAQVTGATTTTIDIVVPQTQCLPARDVLVTVTTTTGGTTPAGTKPVKPGTFVNMALGEMVLLQDASDFCFQFEDDPTVRSYLLGVQSAATAGAGLTGASVLGVVQGPAPSTVAPNFDFTASQGFVPTGLDERAERWRRHREAEAEARVADLELAESIMRSGIDFAPAAARQLVDSTVTVGQSVSFKVPKLAGSCTDFTTVTTTVKAVGLRGIWLRDNANLGPGFLDTDYQNLSDQLDNFIFDVDTSYFGEPTDQDRNARIVILVTQQLNEDNPNLLGFVTSADFFPVSACQRSNFAEVYYAKAPGQGYPRDVALSDAPVLIAHEFTHIIQFGRRLVTNQGQFMAAFMAEGQATLAEEVVGHAALGNTSGQNFGFNVAFDGSDTDPNDWYRLPFSDISFFYGRVFSGPAVANAPHACSWLTVSPAPCGGRSLWYGVTWSLLRWVSDHFGPSFPGGGGERAIQKALVDNDLRGLENIENVIGVPIETFLAEWAATLYLDDRGVAGLPARLDFPSWNLLNIYEGGGLSSSAKLDPIRIVFTNFDRDVDVRAASTAYFVLAGDVQSPTAVRVRDQADGQLPPNMQVFLVRIF